MRQRTPRNSNKVIRHAPGQEILNHADRSNEIAINPANPEPQASDVPETFVGRLNCDACGAAISADAQVCQYCGCVPVILVQGVRLSVLLSMYLEANRYDEAQALSTDLLKDYPQSPIAWIVKGICTLRLGTVGAFGIRNVTAEDIQGAVQCFKFAAASGHGGVSDLRKRAADACLRTIALWRPHWSQAYVENAMLPLSEATKAAFTCLHQLAYCGEKLDPSTKTQSTELLEEVDDAMERRFNWVWVPEGKKDKIGRRQHEYRTVQKQENDPVWIWVVVAALGFLYFLVKNS
jgi:hypothetical protein